MQRLTLHRPVPDALRGSVVALGNFDGFHLGHQAVVGRAVQRGAHERRPVIVATFDPHPVKFFKPDVPPFRLTTLDQRERLFALAGRSDPETVQLYYQIATLGRRDLEWAPDEYAGFSMTLLRMLALVPDDRPPDRRVDPQADRRAAPKTDLAPTGGGSGAASGPGAHAQADRRAAPKIDLAPLGGGSGGVSEPGVH